MRFISNLVRRTDYISRLLHDVDEQPRSASAAPTMGAGDEMHRSVSSIRSCDHPRAIHRRHVGDGVFLPYFPPRHFLVPNLDR